MQIIPDTFFRTFCNWRIMRDFIKTRIGLISLEDKTAARIWLIVNHLAPLHPFWLQWGQRGFPGPLCTFCRLRRILHISINSILWTFWTGLSIIIYFGKRRNASAAFLSIVTVKSCSKSKRLQQKLHKTVK